MHIEMVDLRDAEALEQTPTRLNRLVERHLVAQPVPTWADGALRRATLSSRG
jgi:hypothetical protein